MGLQARSSVGERYLDTVEVGGSIPPVPTILIMNAYYGFVRGMFPYEANFFQAV